MKIIKRLYKWILISVILQVLLLSYVNFIYLPNRGNVKATMYEAEAVSIKSRSMKIPQDAENITVSYNGLYAAYETGGDIIIANLDKRKEVKTLSKSAGDFSFFRWLPDRDMLIYAINEPDGKSGQVRISTYDIDQELERSYPNITELAKGSTVVDIELSPLTNVVYTMIKTGESKTKVYKFNIMDNLSYIMGAATDTILKETLYSDNLVYQKADGKITFRKGKSGKSSALSLKGSYVLMETDGEDRIYAGRLNDNKLVESIVFGKMDVKAASWETKKLDTPAAPSNVLITPAGGIFVNNPEEKNVTSVTDGEITTYEGELLDILDNYLIALDGKKLGVIALSKD